MNVDYICHEVKLVKRKFHETDPFKLCHALAYASYMHQWAPTTEPAKDFSSCKAEYARSQ